MVEALSSCGQGRRKGGVLRNFLPPAISGSRSSPQVRRCHAAGVSSVAIMLKADFVLR